MQHEKCYTRHPVGIMPSLCSLKQLLINKTCQCQCLYIQPAYTVPLLLQVIFAITQNQLIMLKMLKLCFSARLYLPGFGLDYYLGQWVIRVNDADLDSHMPGVYGQCQGVALILSYELDIRSFVIWDGFCKSSHIHLCSCMLDAFYF